MTGITNLLAAQLSFAAYTRLSDYQQGFVLIHGQHVSLNAQQFVDDTDAANPYVATLPSGWSVDIARSRTGSVNGTQVLVFANTTTHQVVMGFRGSTEGAQYWSDFVDSGASAWRGMRAAAQLSLADVQAAYSGYEVLTDGHSLGGGMAQIFALKNNLNGYGQNSLPIPYAIQNDVADFPGGFSLALNNYFSSAHGFSEVIVKSDIARVYENGIAPAIYLSAAPLVLDDIYAAQIQLATGIAGALNSIVGMGLLVSSSFKAHSVQTVISALQSGTMVNQTTPFSSSQIDAYRSSLLGASSVVGQNGSVVLTQTDGRVFTVTPVPSATALMALSAPVSGQSYLYDVASHTGFTVAGSSWSSPSEVVRLEV